MKSRWKEESPGLPAEDLDWWYKGGFLWGRVCLSTEQDHKGVSCSLSHGTPFPCTSDDGFTQECMTMIGIFW